MLKMTEYSKRRKALMQSIGSNSIAIIPAALERLRNGDAYYPFRQNSDFLYLSGFDEPESVLVIAPKRKQGEFILFNRVRDRDREIWDGPRAGQEGATKEFFADQAFPIHELQNLLPDLLAGRDEVYYPIGLNKEFDQVLLNAVNQIRSKIRGGLKSPTAFVDIAFNLHEMRLIKSNSEIETMQKAVDITEKAHVRAMQLCKPGMFEYELEAEILYIFKKYGAQPAYSSIVGSGRNSCVLHYITNKKKIEAGDLVLIDAGCEYQHYASDITRTFPANGKFSSEQRDIYQLVLDSQLAAIKSIKPGSLWTDAQDVIVKVITQGLIDLGILRGNLSDLIEQNAYFPFYMHRSGHWLGLDVHDVGQYRQDAKWRALKPGMAFTVEPGIYISADIPKVHKRWHNIGVRIEDNVVVTEKGCDVLSKKIPKTVEEIESIMAG